MNPQYLPSLKRDLSSVKGGTQMEEVNLEVMRLSHLLKICPRNYWFHLSPKLGEDLLNDPREQIIQHLSIEHLTYGSERFLPAHLILARVMLLGTSGEETLLAQHFIRKYPRVYTQLMETPSQFLVNLSALGDYRTLVDIIWLFEISQHLSHEAYLKDPVSLDSWTLKLDPLLIAGLYLKVQLKGSRLRLDLQLLEELIQFLDQDEERGQVHLLLLGAYFNQVWLIIPRLNLLLDENIQHDGLTNLIVRLLSRWSNFEILAKILDLLRGDLMEEANLEGIHQRETKSLKEMKSPLTLAITQSRLGDSRLLTLLNLISREVSRRATTPIIQHAIEGFITSREMESLKEMESPERIQGIHRRDANLLETKPPELVWIDIPSQAALGAAQTGHLGIFKYSLSLIEDLRLLVKVLDESLLLASRWGHYKIVEVVLPRLLSVPEFTPRKRVDRSSSKIFPRVTESPSPDGINLSFSHPGSRGLVAAIETSRRQIIWSLIRSGGDTLLALKLGIREIKIDLVHELVDQILVSGFRQPPYKVLSELQGELEVINDERITLEVSRLRVLMD